MLKGDPDVASWSTYVGRGAIRFYLPLDVKLANDFFSQAVVIAKDVPARERLHAKLEKALAEQLPNAVVRVSPLELGPPVGWPVQYRVSGPDPAQVRALALKLGQAMGENASLRLVNFDWMEPSREVRVKIDQDQARLLGLSSQTLADTLNAVMSGTPITQVRDGIYLINVVARANDEQRVSLSTLRSLQLPLPGGRTVPLSQIATFDFDQEFPLIWRRDRVPTLTVQADVNNGATPEGAVRSLEPAIEKLEAGLPAGYHIATGGTVEESAQSQASVFALLPAALFLMLLFLMAQLHSFGRVALVVATVPLGLIGIVLALIISNRPLGFVAILGILALVGMIARNAVILIDQIETERMQGRDIWDAVVEATLSRFRPIMLTAISTVLGLIPIAPTVFWGPMAFAIMGGLFVATMLTLLVLPVFYITLYRAKRPERRRPRPSVSPLPASLSCPRKRASGALEPMWIPDFRGNDIRRALQEGRGSTRPDPRRPRVPYCFFSGVIGVTGCEPPVDFGPGVTPALFSSFCVAALELLAAVEPIFGVAPAVGPLPASFVDTAPLVGPLPASPFICANAGADRPIATRAASAALANRDMGFLL